MYPDSLTPWRQLCPTLAFAAIALSLMCSRRGLVAEETREVVGLEGRVVDDAGAPIAAVIVRPLFQQGKETTTDAAGHFRCTDLTKGRKSLLFLARGKAPRIDQIAVAPHAEPLQITMRPARSIRFLVVDKEGAPIDEARISIDNWSGGYAPIFHTKTDSQGSARWDEAPEGAIEYHVGKSQFAIADVSLTADGEEHRVVLYPKLKIAGAVTDAVTEQPIDQVLAVPIRFFRPDWPNTDRQDAQSQTGGRFAVEFDDAKSDHAVQIEARGYQTVRTDRYRAGQENPQLAFRMMPAEILRGQVLGPEGEPLENALVYIFNSYQGLTFYGQFGEKDDPARHNYWVRSTSDGRFEIASQIGPYRLMVIDDRGYAQVERTAGQQPGVIQLGKWAQVRGRLLQDGAGVPDWQVYIRPIRHVMNGQPYIQFSFRAKTAPDGSFEFDRVPPGLPCHLIGDLHFAVESPLTAARSVPLCLNPGEEATIELGGGGREVTGRLVLDPLPPGEFDYHFAINYLVARRPGITPLASLAGAGFDWRHGWSDAWRNTAEGQAYLDSLHYHLVKPAPDGRFRISGVAPGEYDFAINLYGKTEGCLVQPVATRVVRLTIDNDGQVLDLGDVTVPSLPMPQVGDMAFDFEADRLEGGKTRLTDFRGKFVLLDFWASWCGPCVEHLGEVEQLRRDCGADAALVVVGMNLDADQEHAREFLADRQLPWHHLLLGDWSSSDVPRRFAIASIPHYVLIDPAGRIVAQETSLEAITPKVNAGLGR